MMRTSGKIAWIIVPLFLLGWLRIPDQAQNGALVALGALIALAAYVYWIEVVILIERAIKWLWDRSARL